MDDSVLPQEVKHIGLTGLAESNSFLFKKQKRTPVPASGKSDSP